MTPAGKHFVRNHCAVPDIDPEQYTLTITGEGLTETVLTLEDLKTKFEKVDVTTVIQCNGNRREDFHYLGMLRLSNVQGVPEKMSVCKKLIII